VAINILIISTYALQGCTSCVLGIDFLRSSTRAVNSIIALNLMAIESLPRSLTGAKGQYLLRFY